MGAAGRGGVADADLSLCRCKGASAATLAVLRDLVTELRDWSDACR
jgi:hypothetical protein